ncbi:MAG: tetratricopeptide repeat protein [Sphingomonadaceae bacterium]
MTHKPNHKAFIRVALTAALATTALAGCSTKAPRADLSASKAQTQLAKGKVDKAIANAEEAVMVDPRNPSYRAVLGAAYMEAGRFQSAATTFDDAMKLGDNSPRTALSLALAKVAINDSAGAQAILHDWRDEIAPSDLGLATSLAGNPNRGVQILSDAMRNGDNSPKVRQNLAYSFALAGDWRSARLMAAEDVPAGQINTRIGEWASRAAPAQNQERVAALINAPMRTDTGQPERLALANFPSAEQLASEASALVPLAQAEQATRNAAEYNPGEELPPLRPYEDTPAEVVRVADAPTAKVENQSLAELARNPVTPEVAVSSYKAPEVKRPANFEQAFAAPAPRGGTVTEVAAQTMQFATSPTVQKAPVRYGATPARNPAQASKRSASNGAHLVQLGSFASEQGARRAWGIYASRWPELANYDMVITEARVRGKNYFRVSAGGFQKVGATSMCGKVKAKGQGCIEWAEGRPLPGALDNDVRMAAR